jgi:hypothetical protein
MRQVDRVMIEDLGIELVQMMENAGLHLAELARSRFCSFGMYRLPCSPEAGTMGAVGLCAPGISPTGEHR